MRYCSCRLVLLVFLDLEIGNGRAVDLVRRGTLAVPEQGYRTVSKAILVAGSPYHHAGSVFAQECLQRRRELELEGHLRGCPGVV